MHDDDCDGELFEVDVNELRLPVNLHVHDDVMNDGLIGGDGGNESFDDDGQDVTHDDHDVHDQTVQSIYGHLWESRCCCYFHLHRHY